MSKAYPSHLTLNQFELLNDLIPEPKPGGRPRQVEMWEIRWHHLDTLPKMQPPRPKEACS